jgi:hypothetical protein
MVLANAQVEIFNNKIERNQTANALLLAFSATGKPASDMAFDPYPREVWIHHNEFRGGGERPEPQGVRSLRLGKVVASGTLPDVLWDGTTRRGVDQAKICISENGDADFVNFDFRGRGDDASTDLKPHACTLPPLPKVTWPGLDNSSANE